MPRANYKPAYVAHIIILFVLLSKLTLRLCRCPSVCVCVALFFAVAHTPHVPLNAFINASPWPNSQHLFLVACSLSLPYTCIHHFAYMMYCWISKLCCHQGSLEPLMAYAAAYGAVCVPSLPLSLSLSGVSVCLCLNVSAEKQKH